MFSLSTFRKILIKHFKRKCSKLTNITIRATTSIAWNSNQLLNPPKFGTVTVLRHLYGDVVSPPTVSGRDFLRDPRLNKGLGFTLEERQALGIQGLQPAAFRTQEDQVKSIKLTVDRYKNALNKYMYLIDLQDSNERLFFRVVVENIDEMMSIVCTPTVGKACKRFGLLYRRPRGLFITINDRGHIFDILKNWPEPDVRAICVTDGERVLGLGDLGAHAMGIPVGMLTMYTALAGIHPHQCLPISLDVGTNNENLVGDPLYVGLHQKRITGAAYFDFIEEFLQAVVKRYGQETFIHFEDFGQQNSFKILKKYRNSYCMLNGDIQSTSAAVLAGLIASKKLTKKKICDHKYLIVGAGQGGMGVARMLEFAFLNDDIPLNVARSIIWMMDSHGLLTTKRTVGNLDGSKRDYAKDQDPIANLEEAIDKIKPSVLIGATANKGLFTPKVLKLMADNNERPIIIPLSNPNEKAECTPEEAIEHTDGRVIFASGASFPPVRKAGRSIYSTQIYGNYVTPGIALGVILTGTYHIPDDIFLLAAYELAAHVSKEDLANGSILPRQNRIRDASMGIAEAVIYYAYENGLASFYPEPNDKCEWITSKLYNYNYESAMPKVWKWPSSPINIKMRPINPTIWLQDSDDEENDLKKKKRRVRKKKC